jgi:diadenylate cyclase
MGWQAARAVEPATTSFYTALAMSEMLKSLFHRLTSEAYDVPAVLVELLLIGLCVNWCAGVLQGTRGTRPLRGVLVILVATTLVVRILTAQFEWVRLDLLYSYILYGLAFIALVVFQPELRRAVIRVGEVRLRRSRSPQSQLIAALVKSAGYLSRNRYGALLAIQRSVDLTGWAENGTMIRAEVSANLLNTIFYPGSPLHDLGVIIQDTQVVAANCQFPSAESDEVDIALGSRHLAAVGMSYETDALVLVVSEETGVISLADNGKLTRFLSLDDLSDELTNRLAGQPAAQPANASGGRRHGRFWRAVRRALMVVPMTLVIWYVADQATSATDTCQVELTIRSEDPSSEVEIVGQSPVFDATFSGPGRAIDRLRIATARQPLPVVYTLPKAYEPRSEPYVLGSREEIRKLVENTRQVEERGLTVVTVGLSSLSFNVFARVAVSLPVDVKAEGGPVRIALERVEPARVDVDVRRDDLKTLEAQGAVYAVLGRQLEGLAPGDVRTFTGIALAPPVGLKGPVKMTPERVTVTVRVVAQPRLVKNVVVGLYVSPEVAERYEVRKKDLNEWRTDVEVQADEAVFENPGALDIRAMALVTSDLLPPAGQPAEEQTRTLPVVFLTPKGVSVVGSRTVQVVLVPRPGSTP